MAPLTLKAEGRKNEGKREDKKINDISSVGNAPTDGIEEKPTVIRRLRLWGEG